MQQNVQDPVMNPEVCNSHNMNSLPEAAHDSEQQEIRLYDNLSIE
uniref:Uncharacterized protein n=1 Tax=Arundo donax TaxID=35708 RepID=A0A0A8ZKK0_ARUDO